MVAVFNDLVHSGYTDDFAIGFSKNNKIFEFENWDYKPSSGRHTVFEEDEVDTVVELDNGGEKYGNSGGGGMSGNGGHSRGRSIGGR